MANQPGSSTWANRVRRLRTTGHTRAAVAECRKHIPYPGAFREAAKAIRTSIRERRRNGEDARDLLRELYWWGVAENFFRYIEWNKIITEDILHPTAIACLEGIECPYPGIGYAHIELLNQTDAKWLVEAFGEPSRHWNAKDANPELWQAAIETFRKAKRRDEQHYWGSRGFDGPPLKRSGTGRRGKGTKPTGCLSMVAVLLLLACVVSLGGLGWRLVRLDSQRQGADQGWGEDELPRFSRVEVPDPKGQTE